MQGEPLATLAPPPRAELECPAAPRALLIRPSQQQPPEPELETSWRMAARFRTTALAT